MSTTGAPSRQAVPQSASTLRALPVTQTVGDRCLTQAVGSTLYPDLDSFELSPGKSKALESPKEALTSPRAVSVRRQKQKEPPRRAAQ